MSLVIFSNQVTPSPQISELHKELCLYYGTVLLRLSFLNGSKMNDLVGSLERGLIVQTGLQLTIYSQGWPRIPDLPAITSQVPKLLVYKTTVGSGTVISSIYFY